MTYTKPLKSIEVTTRGGSTFSATDTASQPIASDALRDFSNKQTMHIKGDNLVLVPFHAVDVVEVTKSVTSVDRADPYGCDGAGGNSKVCEAKACVAKASC